MKAKPMNTAYRIFSVVPYLAVLCGVACSSPGIAGVKLPPYCFIAEVADKHVFERLSNVTPIAEETVLLFPLVTGETIDRPSIYVALGPPVLYRQGTDHESIRFRDVENWPKRRYLVWARGYYPRLLDNLFVYTNTVFGKTCIVEELMPLKPGTDRARMEKAILDELRKGEITVQPPLKITDDVDYAKVIQARSVFSWMGSANGAHKDYPVWGLPIGSKLTILLTPDDYSRIESFIQGGKPKSGGASKLP